MINARYRPWDGGHEEPKTSRRRLIRTINNNVIKINYVQTLWLP